MTDTLTAGERQELATPLSGGFAAWFSRHWFAVFTLAIGLYAGLPFLAPVFMFLGWSSLGKLIYAIYSTQCHQLPERSFFLFGHRFMYSLGEIQAAWKNTLDPMVLRRFIGNPVMGWKVAWSDRMVSMYGGTFLCALLWGGLRRATGRRLSISWWAFALLLLPMALDGGTHFISDLAGLGQGFRDSNAWLAILTQHIFPATFYAGDAMGSFNSLMRLLTGLLFGFGVVWFGFPYLEEWFNPASRFERAA